jgi:iron(III) transport system permease protein
MDDQGDIAAAAAMGMMIFYTNVSVRVAYVIITQKILVKFQSWRHVGGENIQATT